MGILVIITSVVVYAITDIRTYLNNNNDTVVRVGHLTKYKIPHKFNLNALRVGSTTQTSSPPHKPTYK